MKDYIREAPHGGRCRVRIYDRVVILTELPDNPGMSVTNAAEEIAGDVVMENALPTETIFIEHYEDGARGTPEAPDTFDLITFSNPEPGRWGVELGQPSWKPLDRATVEKLIGGRVE